MPVPMIWEGKKGEPSKPVMPLDLNVRPIVDGNYIIPKTVEYIKRNAAAKKPFFVYVGYSEMHPPMIGNPDFVGKSTQRGGLFADIIGEMDYRVGQILDAVKEAGVDDNTIVILSSDNAGGGAVPQVGPGSNGPWRGDFLNTPFEGSMRAPASRLMPANVSRDGRSFFRRRESPGKTRSAPKRLRLIPLLAESKTPPHAGDRQTSKPEEVATSLRLEIIY
jgi:hypothetical protein